MKKSKKKSYQLSSEIQEKLKEQAEIRKNEEFLKENKKELEKKAKKEEKRQKKLEKKELKKAKKLGKFKFSKFVETLLYVIYLGFLLFCVGKFFSVAKSNKTALIFGCLTTVLAFGGIFHFIPKILNNLKRGGLNRKDFWFGLGNQISTITITWFYLLLYFVYRLRYPKNLPGLAFEISLAVTIILRVLICFLPQNRWYTKERSLIISIIRNLLFLITGIMEIVIFAMRYNGGFGIWTISIAIGLSLIFYLPVSFGEKKYPKLRILWIPEILCYTWIICMGLTLI